MERSKKEHNKKRRSSSRLQKHAPPALQVDGTKVDEDGFGRYAIPLLSPLLLSPAAPEVVVVVVVAAADAKGKELAPGEITGQGGGDEVALSTTTATEGWKHPAVGVAMEPSKLGALFQSQCMLLNNM